MAAAKRILDLKKLYFVLLQSSMPVVVTDSNGKIVFANKGIELISGYSKKEVLGKTPAVWGGKMSKDFYENLWDTLKNKKKVFIGEILNKKKNGQLYPVEVNITPILNKKGVVEFFVGTEHDISKFKERERYQREFISLVSHQLRTPLAAMKWVIEILLQEKYGFLSDKQEEAMINIYSSNERLINLVNDLLNINKIEAGGAIVSLSPVDIIKDTKQLIKIFKPLSLSKKQKIVFIYHKIPKIIIIDPILYSQIIQNLLSNALTYGKENSDVIISLDREKDFMIVRVTNFGDMIPLTDRKNLFTKFFRGERAKKINTHGTGLGLYIIKQVVDKLGGKVGFSSTKKKTEFYFTFPLVKKN